MLPTIPFIDKQELKEFVERNEIGEPFNYSAEFMYRLTKGDKLVGIVAYMLEKDKEGNEFPRFIHVIFDEGIRKTRTAVKFVIDSLVDIQNKGYEVVVAVIPHWKKHMIRYARKFRFKEFSSDEKYGYYMLRFIKPKSKLL